MKSRVIELMVLIGSAIVIALLAFGRQEALNELPHSIYSTNDTGPNGYRALYDVLQSAGVRVSRFSRVLGVLDGTTSTLVISTNVPDPNPNAMDSHDTVSFKQFVERGGRLVVLDYGFVGKDDVFPGVPAAISAKGTGAVSMARDRYTAGVQRVTAPITSVFPFTTRSGIPLLGNDSGIVALAYPLGKGTVIAITEPSLFSNAHLANADNARFAYNVISGHGPVAFDEYVHGTDDDLSFWSALPSPVHAAIWIVGAIVLLALIGANVPFAPTVPLDPPEERDSSAYIDAMAALLRRARAAPAVITAFAADAARLRRGGDAAQRAFDRLEGLTKISHPTDAALVEAAVLDYRLRKDLT
jgi:hypothetical protein